MSPGGAKPLTSPVPLALRATSVRAMPPGRSAKISSYSVPCKTPDTHQVTWSWMGVTWPGRRTMATIEKEPSVSACSRWDW